jgi:hypothetical protein
LAEFAQLPASFSRHTLVPSRGLRSRQSYRPHAALSTQIALRTGYAMDHSSAAALGATGARGLDEAARSSIRAACPGPIDLLRSVEASADRQCIDDHSSSTPLRMCSITTSWSRDITNTSCTEIVDNLKCPSMAEASLYASLRYKVEYPLDLRSKKRPHAI